MAGPAGKRGPDGTVIRSRMAPRLVPATPRAYIKPTIDRAVARTATVAKGKVAKNVRATGRAPVDDQYKARVLFSQAHGSDAGKTWSEPLQLDTHDDAGHDMYWRCEIDQFRVDPLLQGFATRWEILTAGWIFVDGLPRTIYDEAISNPLVITRVVHAPSAISRPPKFRVVVTAKYRP